MTMFLVNVRGTATIGEQWLVEADSADEAREMVDNGEHDQNLVSDWIEGDEADREVVGVFEADEDELAKGAADDLAKAAAPAMLAALEMVVSLPDAMTAIARAYGDRWQEVRAAIAAAKGESI